MHRKLRELLPRAKGESHLVVVVFLDVRGFSSFARLAESSEAALFLRSMYTTILTKYFPEAAFFKPTGDGLMVILDYNDDNLAEVVNNAVVSSVALVENFEVICDGDPMVNFPVPKDLGIGVARGAATALVSGRQVLDYSGRPLNLAARLMDLARPRGVVYSRDLGHELIKREYADRFDEELVYIKGISEDEPVRVHILRGSVELPETSKRPLHRVEWKLTKEKITTFKQVAQRTRMNHVLPVEPALPNDIRVHITHPSITANGRKHPRFTRTATMRATYVGRAGKHYAHVNYQPTVARLQKAGVKPAWPVKIVIEYAVPEGAPAAEGTKDDTTQSGIVKASQRRVKRPRARGVMPS